MKFLEISFRKPDRWLHPMQAFIRDTDVVEYEELLTWNLLPGQPVEYELFYVEASDRDRYRSAIETVESVRWYDLTPIDDTSFYVYVCQETREEDRQFRRAFEALELVVLPPIGFDRTGTMRMTIVGEGTNLQQLVENVPTDVDTAIQEIGEFDRRHRRVTGSLTDRQLEALTVGLECGYYELPRSGSIEDVADALGCASSTASNHLRKAEAAIVQRLVG
ncbi:bacterio-opsin activator [Salinadaptatus halalkaliphilus]|uniref:Bacterio-opsin activator n=1 Tax=Salinadaptatus halalkaliphilus TaxID=2419781 RepID=A0A4S3TQU0_9EURY|nr:helix-turn-helix domain-containing protein [Salinadaptatus halalkaliphilus]THE66779.1 bacterio-opsin activator [Salinadaptatus halalkaliphilus]